MRDYLDQLVREVQVAAATLEKERYYWLTPPLFEMIEQLKHYQRLTESLLNHVHGARTYQENEAEVNRCRVENDFYRFKEDLMGLLLGLGIPGVYLAGVLITARILHIKVVRSYLRWKNEAPDKKAGFTVGYDFEFRKRKEISELQYQMNEYTGYDRGVAFLWPFIGPYAAIKGFCFPEVKLPDVTKIDELEKL